MSIHNDIRSLTPGALIELFVLDLTQLNGPILRFFAGTNVLRAPIVWQGQAYNPLAVEADGFEFSGGGQLPRPKIRIANKDSAITSLLLIYNDLRGAKVLRRRTFAKYLDAVNFPGGVNTSANPMTAFPDDVFVIDRKVGESRDVVELELTAAFDLVNVQLPLRQIVANSCRWKYKGAGCGYVPGAMFKRDGTSTTTPAEDSCSKLLKTGCKPRFGADNPLPFGAFPAAGLIG